jgi:DNA-binding transcriptional LysR family regulator
MAVALHLNFTKAASSLHITQSALSQRINQLEQKLGLLFIRNTKSVHLTTLGNQLLRYTRNKVALENEFLGQISTNTKNSLNGIIRIAGISTALRFFILPALKQFLIQNPTVKLELLELELRELPMALEKNQADFIISSQCINKKYINTLKIGIESYVLVKSNQYTDDVSDIYLDHDIEDETTHLFLKKQRKPISCWRQHHLDNVHLIIEAVKLGIGRAVLPCQILTHEPNLQSVKGMKPLNVPIYLIYYKQEYYNKLQQSVIEVLQYH